MMEIPKTNCKGCDGRDRIIALIAAALDEESHALEALTSLMHRAAPWANEVEQAELEAVTPRSAA